MSLKPWKLGNTTSPASLSQQSRRDRQEGPAAAEPSATRAAAPAPVFVYKPGSGSERNTAPLPGAQPPLSARKKGLLGIRDLPG